MAKKLYVGNIPFTTTEADLRAMFETHGAVTSVKVITDRETGRSRGFAFVEMDDATAAQNAIRALDGSQMGGRSLRVNEAQDRREGGGGGGGGRGGYGGGGGRGGYGGGGGGGYGGGGGGGRGGYGGGGGGYGGGRDRDRDRY
ncbi:MAG: RNA-binding protein [Deltaproteobacteria bacterium]|nr:RNA-binding protein [Deltaproteobacteria bacterium]